MEKKFYITCDSSVDLPAEYIKENDIKLVPIKYIQGDTEYADDMETESKNAFYKRFREGILSKTGSYNGDDVEAVWNTTGEPILHVCLSSGLSICYEHCVMRAKEMKKEVKVLDSLFASLGAGVLLIKAVELRDKGLSLDEAYKELEEFRYTINTNYTTPTLEYFYKGGRLKRSKYIIGKLLHINPILKVDAEGKLYIDKKCHGTKKSENEIIEDIKEKVINPENQTLYICHADCLDNAIALGERIKNEVGFKDTYVTLMGPTIGSHCGPELRAYFFLGKDRRENQK